MNVLTALQAKGIPTRRVASTRGGEWAGPCPICRNGRDRFRVWPYQEGRQGGGYWCRQCQKGGDLIQFYRDVEGLDYKQACAAAGADPKHYIVSTPRPPKAQKEKPVAAVYKNPSEAWMNHAARFVRKCHERLMANQAALDWLLRKRGLDIFTVERFNLGLNRTDFFGPREDWGLETEISSKTHRPKKLWIPRGLVIPYQCGDQVQRIRVRRSKVDLRSDADPRYYFVPGSSPAIARIGDACSRYIVVESDLDGQLIAQDIVDFAGVVILGTSSAKPDAATLGYLNGANIILVALDADAAGVKAATWWTDNFSQAARWPPVNGKDPGDMFHSVDVRAWVMAGLYPLSQNVDLSVGTQH